MSQFSKGIFVSDPMAKVFQLVRLEVINSSSSGSSGLKRGDESVEYIVRRRPDDRRRVAELMWRGTRDDTAGQKDGVPSMTDNHVLQTLRRFHSWPKYDRGKPEYGEWSSSSNGSDFCRISMIVSGGNQSMGRRELEGECISI